MKITWAPEARRQIHEIWHYIALDSPETADRMVTRLTAAVEKLTYFPHLGRPGREGARELVVGGTNFIVIDRVEGEEIRIGTVVHGAQRGRGGGRD
jgi:toxin ParE1/3/4